MVPRRVPRGILQASRPKGGVQHLAFGHFGEILAEFWALLNPRGRQKPSKKINTATCWHPWAANKHKKKSCGRGSEKDTKKMMKERCGNQRFSRGRKHVWRYALRIFHIFVIFEKIEKSMPKGKLKIMLFDERWSLERPRVDR